MPYEGHRKTARREPLQLNTDLSQSVVIATHSRPWVLSPAPGVHRKMLERDGGETVRRATSVVRYAPGARFKAHIHDGGEEFFVLEGCFSDDTGDYPAGSYVRNPPHSAHAPFSREGCTIFVKLGQIPARDRRTVRINSASPRARWMPCGQGAQSLLLYESAFEHVCLMRWPGGYSGAPVRFEKGLEMFVLKGAFTDAFGRHGPGSWLRLAPGESHALQVLRDCEAWVKSGHLAPGL